MVVVRLKNGKQRQFPGASYSYDDGELVVRDARGKSLGSWKKSRVRGFSQSPDPDPAPVKKAARKPRARR